MEKKKTKNKGLKRIFMVLGVIVGIIIIAGAGIFLYLRSQFAAPRVVIGNVTDDAIVKTGAGSLRGYISDGIYTYHGIPYAEAAERFVPAEKVTPWKGVLDVAKYGKISPQGAILGMSVSDDADETDNNSQNLNLWTPGINDGKKRPVMVWLHGGGFSMGSANDATSDGTALSKSGDVVVVGVNHRLNVYGHMDLSAYGEKYQYSANVGMMDIVMALEWIQENIETFGGDPGNVTVFGQSGGGAKVLSLMISPYAKGLFHKGIVESGATEMMGVKFSSKEESQRLTENILKHLGISADNIDALQTVSNKKLQDAAGSALQETGVEFQIPAPLSDDYGMEWGPVIDGDFMPTNPVTEDSFAEMGKDIPLLIGSNLNEWTGMRAAARHSDLNDKQINAYVSAYPNKDRDEADKVDTFIRLPMLKIMSHKADQGGAPVYAYVFTYDNGAMGAYHGAEIPYVFAHESGKLGKEVSQAWINFARSGIPGADGLPDWEPYTRERRATMLLDTQSELVYNHDTELMRLLEPDYVY
ncbi:carboxylesterase/lipase family protein [Bacillus sp. USDA818B3_A]|uniref:carboxylesterase/lipase family protein n=1 Tax=Bacillus sp. USDA818B3_A TaxID=2698834 RepID=UPI00136913CB|nr:carboxylesterase family protein [Bacillus sp. USDA818B3_A]